MKYLKYLKRYVLKTHQFSCLLSIEEERRSLIAVHSTSFTLITQTQSPMVIHKHLPAFSIHVYQVLSYILHGTSEIEIIFL